jgi:hypothetical protein
MDLVHLSSMRRLAKRGSTASNRRPEQPGSGNITPDGRGFQPRRGALSTPFRRGGKMRLAAPQKTIYNQLAKDGTRGLATRFSPPG